MNRTIDILDPCTSGDWIQFISTHPDAGIFHHPAWMRMLRDIYGYRMFAVCVKEGGRIVAGIPFADVHSFITGRRWVSLPFSDHCRPLLPENHSEVRENLVAYLKQQQGKEIPRIEIRWNLDSSPPLFKKTGFVVHTLHLAGADEGSLLKSFHQQAQRSIRKAERGGVTVRECATFDEFEHFYRLLVLTRKRLGVPVQPKAFFKGVWEHIIRHGLGHALIAYDHATPIGGGVFFTFNGTMLYKYGASDMAYKDLQPNYAYMWSGIKHALADGCTRFDFGRSENEHEGLRRFKSGWASQESNLVYTLLADHAPRVGPSRLDLVTGSVIRHTPAFVCTMSGRLLYKHFA